MSSVWVLFAALVLRTYMVFLRLYITLNKFSYARISCWCFQVQENFFHRNERDNNIQPFKFGGHKSGNVQFGELIHVISVIKVSKVSILSVFGRYSPCHCFWKTDFWFPFVKFFCKTSNISTYLESRGSITVDLANRTKLKVSYYEVTSVTEVEYVWLFLQWVSVAISKKS